jgi:GNAT superfamily N-acetyltransferase
MDITISKVNEKNFDQFYGMIVDFAKFEKLLPPDKIAQDRLKKDLFIKYEGYIATQNRTPIGFVIFYFTYSDFMAKHILYLEDIYVVEQYRKLGVGKQLFEFCIQEAKKRHCGRMEWAVLNWNKNAIDFYESYGGERQPIYIYRLDEAKLSRFGKTG